MDISKLIPEAEVLANFITWADVMAWSKLGAETWMKVSQSLGEEGLEDFPTIAALGDEDYWTAMDDVKLNAIQRTRVNLAVNVVRAAKGMQVSNITAKAKATVPLAPLDGMATTTSALALVNGADAPPRKPP